MQGWGCLVCLQGLRLAPCRKGSNQTHKGEKMKTTKLLSIFGAKISKDGNKLVLTLVSGEDKAEALFKCVTGPVTPEVPGSILQFHPDVTIICDAAAYSKF